MKTNKMRHILRSVLLAGVIMMLVMGVFSMESTYAATKKPAKVVLQKVASHDYNAVKLTWKKAANAKKYQVYRATSKNGKYKLVKTVKGTTFVNKKLTTGKKYYYKVRGINGKVKGKFSAVKSAAPKLKAVKGLSAKKELKAVELSWSKVKGAAGYEVYRCKTAKGKFKQIGIARELSYWDGGLSFGKTYYYKIRAFRNDGGTDKYGAFSKVVKGSTLTMQGMRQEMLKQMNAEREKRGLVPLKLYKPVNETAQEKAKDLLATGEFDHYSENLGYFYDQYDKKNLPYFAGAENIAWGQGSVDAVMESWMNSKGHKANILGYQYTHVGIGYHKGYWVQQFIARSDVAKNPEVSWVEEESEASKDGFDMKCRYCKKTYFQQADRILYSLDAAGNKYTCYQCTNCNRLLEKCPKCENGWFEDAGLTDGGSVARKCNLCDNPQTDTCIETCSHCGDKVLDNTEYATYQVAFDSTNTYDGKSYTREDGCYFQHIRIEMVVCKSCNRYAIVESWGIDTYEACYNLLKENLGTEENIFDYIKWEIMTGTEPVASGDGWSTYRELYEFVDTPHVRALTELQNTEKIQ